ncbi:MAG: hypothetical protein AAFY20_23515 [Cyanobacteria bacterium J06639_14]
MRSEPCVPLQLRSPITGMAQDASTPRCLSHVLSPVRRQHAMGIKRTSLSEAIIAL